MIVNENEKQIEHDDIGCGFETFVLVSIAFVLVAIPASLLLCVVFVLVF